MKKIENTKGKYKLQHYVPQFLLKNFGRKIKKNKFKIRGFNLEKMEQIENTTEGFCAENFFYEKTNPKITELYLKKIEGKTSKLISTIIEKKSIQFLDKKKIEIFNEFLFYQIIRTRYMRNEFKQYLIKSFNLQDEKAEAYNCPDILLLQ